MTTEQATVPSTPVDRDKLKGMIQEASICMQKIDDQREAMKDIYDLIKEDFAIAPKFSRKMVKAYYKNLYAEMQHESTEFELLYEAIIGLD